MNAFSTMLSSLCSVQRMQNLDEVADVDWEQVDRPGWEVDDVVSLSPATALSGI